MLKPNFNWLKWRKIIWLLVSTILKNDGVRQWEGWHPIYEMENKSNVWNPTSTFDRWNPKFSLEIGANPSTPCTSQSHSRAPPAWLVHSDICAEDLFLWKLGSPQIFIAYLAYFSMLIITSPTISWVFRMVYIYTYNVRPPSYKLVYKPQ